VRQLVIKVLNIIDARCNHEVLILSTILSVIFVIFRRIRRDVIKNVHRSTSKLPIISVGF